MYTRLHEYNNVRSKNSHDTDDDVAKTFSCWLGRLSINKRWRGYAISVSSGVGGLCIDLTGDYPIWGL